MGLESVVILLTRIIPLAPIISALFLSNKLEKRAKITILSLCIVSFSTDIIGEILVHFQIYTYVTFHVYTFLTGLIICFYYISIFKQSKIIPILGMLIFILTCLLSTKFWGGLNAVNDKPDIILALISIGYSFAYFIRCLNELKFEKITYDIHFWISFAILFGQGGALFFSIFESIIRSVNGLTNAAVFFVIYIANIGFSAILTAGLWYTTKQTLRSQS